jgi:hypothetical protein
LPIGVFIARVVSFPASHPIISEEISEPFLILTVAARSITLAKEVTASAGREFLASGFVKSISSAIIVP